MATTSTPLLKSLRRLYSSTVTRKRVLASVPKEVTFEAGGAAIQLEVSTWQTANFVKNASRSGRFDYEPQETALFLELLDGVDTFLDVGSHIGYYALLAAATDRSRRVVSFEILDSFADEVERHARNNGLDNLSLERRAIGAGGEAVQFENYADRSTKTGISLDEYTAEHDLSPDLIKLDIEGHEVRGIGGMQRLLSEERPTLMLAFHPPMIRERGLEPVDALLPLWEAGYVVEEVVDGAHGELFGLRRVSRTTVPTELCMLLCRSTR